MQTTTGQRKREDIAIAVFNLVQAATGIVGATRRLKHWDEVPEAEMPYCCVVQGRHGAKPPAVRGIPYTWTLQFSVFLYVTVGNDDNATPATQLNTHLDALEAALTPQYEGQRNTLNGLVHDCRIVGEVETDEGALGNISVAIVPIEVLA